MIIDLKLETDMTHNFSIFEIKFSLTQKGMTEILLVIHIIIDNEIIFFLYKIIIKLIFRGTFLYDKNNKRFRFLVLR